MRTLFFILIVSLLSNFCLFGQSANLDVEGDVKIIGNIDIHSLGSSSSLFIGKDAGLNNSSGHSNLFVGVGAGENNTSGTRNTFIGMESGRTISTSHRNTFVGFRTGYSNDTGTNNNFFGSTSGISNTSGSFNCFFGNFSGGDNTTGGTNSFYGHGTGGKNISGNRNSYFVSLAGYENLTSSDNAFFGYKAGHNATGGGNSFYGSSAGYVTFANQNSFFGAEVGYSNTTGFENSFYGGGTGYGNTIGQWNSFYGKNSGYSNIDGNSNSFFGRYSGNLNTSGNENSFFGRAAGAKNSTASDNSFFGSEAGKENTTGQKNTFVGANADISDSNSQLDRSIAIGYNSMVDCSNCAVIGGVGLDAVNVGIGTSNPETALHVEGRNGQYGAKIINTDATPMIVERAGNDGGIIDIHKNGSYVGDITVVGGVVSYNSFTGSHLAHSKDSFEYGELVILTGINKNLTIDKWTELIYGIDKSQRMNRNEVLGTYMSPLDKSEQDEQNIHTIMAVGNGAMWVVDSGENIRIGDNLISSPVAGHGMKDPESHRISHVIAKALENVVWENETVYLNKTKHKLISVSFEQFDKVNENELRELLYQLFEENRDLKSRILNLEKAHIGELEN